MITIIIAVILILLIALAVYLLIKNLEEYNKVQRESMSFLESYNLTGLPIITFECNGKKLNFVLDTGASESMTSKSVTDKLHCRILNLKDTYVTGIEGNDELCKGCIIPITYKNKEFVGNFLVKDLEGMFKKIKELYGVQISGFLGSGFFKKYQYVIDFESMIAYSKRKK